MGLMMKKFGVAGPAADDPGIPQENQYLRKIVLAAIQSRATTASQAMDERMCPFPCPG